MRDTDPAEPVNPYQEGKSRPFRPDERLARIGRLQHRQVTTAQLHRVGWSDRVIAARVAAGRLHPVFFQVYSLGGPPQSDKERWMAATLSFGPGTKLAASAAAELHGWLRFPLNEIHVLTSTPRKSRDGIATHHTTKPVSRQRIDKIPVTGPEQTILACATTIRSDKLYRRIVRIAQAEKHTSHPRLLAFAAMSKGVRGVARLKCELREGPSPTRSANEDEILELFRHGGEPVSNAIVHGEEVDLYFPEHNTAIEVMSELHDNPAALAHDTAKKARLERRGTRVLWLR